MQAARQQLDQSAREVADLSRQLHGGQEDDVMSFVHGGPKGSMLGINISGGAARDEGVDVVGVSPGGPAEQAGLKAGDVVIAVDGKALRRSGERSASAQLVEYMRGVEPGKVVKVDYLRDGKKQAASVTTAPAEPPIVRVIRRQFGGPDGEGLPFPGLEMLLGPGRAFGSLELVPVTPKLGSYFGTDRGLLVVRAPAAKGLPLEEGRRAADHRRPHAGQSGPRVPYPAVVPARREGEAGRAAAAQAADARSHDAGPGSGRHGAAPDAPVPRVARSRAARTACAAVAGSRSGLTR